MTFTKISLPVQIGLVPEVDEGLSGVCLKQVLRAVGEVRLPVAGHPLSGEAVLVRLPSRAPVAHVFEAVLGHDALDRRWRIIQAKMRSDGFELAVRIVEQILVSELQA